MTTYITQQDVDQLLQFAALSAAQKLGVADSDWEPTEKLAEKIRLIDTKIGDALDAFVNAYNAWFKYVETGNQSNYDSGFHTQLVLKRDQTRSAFISALRSSA